MIESLNLHKRFKFTSYSSKFWASILGFKATGPSAEIFRHQGTILMLFESLYPLIAVRGCGRITGMLEIWNFLEI